MANDGEVIIEVSLETGKVVKGAEQASKKIGDGLGKNINKSVNDIEKNIGKIGTAVNKINVSNLAKEFSKVDNSINKTNTYIEKQKQKLEGLKAAYKGIDDTKSQEKIQQQMKNTELSISRAEKQLDKFNNKKLNLNNLKEAANGLDGNFSSASMKATKSLDNIEKKAQQTGNVVKKSLNNITLGDNIGNLGKTIDGVGNKLTMGVTVPVVGLGVAINKIGGDFSSQMSRVKAISGANTQEFKQLHDQSLQLGADTAFSAKQAAEGMENLASAGFTTNEIMTAMPGLLDLAASSGESLANSSDIAASTLRGFGLDASQTAHVADVLAKNASATNAAVADTGEAMKYASPVAKAMGLSLEEVTAAIGEMANAGIKGSQAGTTLRTALTRLASPSDPAATKMEELGFKAFDSQGRLFSLSKIIDNLSKSLKGKTDQQKQDAIATIFGQEAMSGMLTLIDNGSSALDTLTDSYKNSDGAAKEMAKTMQDNSKSSIEQMMGSIETAAIKLQEVAAPTIIKIANEIQELANEFSELDPGTQEMIIKAVLAAAALGPLAKTIGTLTEGVGGLIKFGSKLGSMLGLIGTGAKAGELAVGGLTIASGAAVAAVSALAVGVAGAITYNSLLNKSVNTSTDDLNAWEKAVNACTGGTIKSKTELQKAGLVYKDFGDDVSDSFKEGIENATKSYHDFEMTLVGSNSGTKITDEGKKNITNSINSMIDGAKGAISKRKGEIQSELSKMFNSKDGIDESEQSVLDTASKASDEKLKKIEEIQTQITGVWEKAIAEHGKLGEEDIAKIKQYLQQVQQIRAEVEAKTTAESDYAKNQYGERLRGISAEDAKKEYTAASEDLKKKFADARATYKTGIGELQRMVEEANAKGDKAEADRLIKQVDSKKKEYDEIIKTEKTKRREYLDMLYEKNPTLNGKLNEEDGSIFSTKDFDMQKDLAKIESQFDAVAKATEDGMIRVQDSTGKWHDIYVTVDQATGNITSAYDSFTGKFGGYSKKFADDAESTGDKVKKAMQDLASNLQFGGDNLKLDGKNVIKVDTGETITKLQTIITKADETKVAIANINGEQVKIEFNKEGAITNIDDVLKLIRDHAADSPAKVDIDVNDKEALEKFKQAEEEADKLGEKKPNVETSTNADQTKNKVEELNKAANSIENHHTITFEAVGKGFAEVGRNVANIAANVGKTVIANNYTGTSGGDEGLTTLHEHGWEMSTGENELYYLGGGTGIMDHQSSVNAMQSDVNKAVNGKIGSVIGPLISGLSSQKALLGQVVNNTGITAVTGKETVKINQSLATNLISNLNKNTTGTFNNLQSELTSANDAKEKTSNMKVEENYWVSYYKQWIDSIKTEIDNLNDKIDITTDETAKKQLESEKKVLDKQKDGLEKQYDLSKDAAQKEIQIAKDTADQQVKIAEAKKEKLVKLSEAITEALKTQLEGQKAAAEKSINDELTTLEKSYNSKIDSLEADTKKKSDKIDLQIKALEKENTEDSRSKERSEANKNIYALKTKMSNTASVADKRALQLQIDEAKKSLKEKEDTWNIEDQKQALEDEKILLQERTENRKKSLEEQYTKEKETKEKELKDTDEFYDKLLTTDSINAQARYLLLQGNNQELVTLLNSYNPDWQNAGQSLADSLLTGLNSSKQSVQDAVNEMVGLRTYSSTKASSNVAYYDEKGNLIKEGYASGTNYNKTAGYYLTNEQKWETSSNGDVAYVSKGAAIKNHMQSVADMRAEITSQLSSELPSILSSLQATILSSQADTQRMIASVVTNNSSSNQTIQYDGSNKFNIGNLVLNTGQDVEQLFNEAETIRLKNKPY